MKENTISLMSHFRLATFIYLLLLCAQTNASMRDVEYVNAFRQLNQSTQHVIFSLARDHSMFEPAYSDRYIEDSSKRYIGIFSPDHFYSYNKRTQSFDLFITGTKTVNARPHHSKPNAMNQSLWSGNFLNWLTTSRLTLLKSVLLGVEPVGSKQYANNEYYYSKSSERSEQFSELPNNALVKVYEDRFVYGAHKFFLSVSSNGVSEPPGLISELRGLASVHIVDHRGELISSRKEIFDTITRWGSLLKKGSMQKTSARHVLHKVTDLFESNTGSECSRALFVSLTFNKLSSDFLKSNDNHFENDCRNDLAGVQSVKHVELILNENDAQELGWVKSSDSLVVQTADSQRIGRILRNYQSAYTFAREGVDRHWLLSDIRIFGGADERRFALMSYSSPRLLASPDGLLVMANVDNQGLLRVDDGDHKLEDFSEDPIVEYCLDMSALLMRFRLVHDFQDLTTEQDSQQCLKRRFPLFVDQINWSWQSSGDQKSYDEDRVKVSGHYLGAKIHVAKPPLEMPGLRSEGFKKFLQGYKSRDPVAYLVNSNNELQAWNLGASETKAADRERFLWSYQLAEYDNNEDLHASFSRAVNYDLSLFDAQVFEDSKLHPGGWATLLAVSYRGGKGKVSESSDQGSGARGKGEISRKNPAIILFDVSTFSNKPKLLGTINLGSHLSGALKLQVVRGEPDKSDEQHSGQWILAVAPRDPSTSFKRGGQSKSSVYYYDLQELVKANVLLISSQSLPINGYISSISSLDIDLNAYTDTLLFATVENTSASGHESGGIYALGVDAIRNRHKEPQVIQLYQSDTPIYQPPLVRRLNNHLELAFVTHRSASHDSRKTGIGPFQSGAVIGLTYGMSKGHFSGFKGKEVINMKDLSELGAGQGAAKVDISPNHDSKGWIYRLPNLSGYDKPLQIISGSYAVSRFQVNEERCRLTTRAFISKVPAYFSDQGILALHGLDKKFLDLQVNHETGEHEELDNFVQTGSTNDIWERYEGIYRHDARSGSFIPPQRIGWFQSN